MHKPNAKIVNKNIRIPFDNLLIPYLLFRFSKQTQKQVGGYSITGKNKSKNLQKDHDANFPKEITKKFSFPHKASKSTRKPNGSEVFVIVGENIFPLGLRSCGLMRETPKSP
jgi:hypothetical protein